MRGREVGGATWETEQWTRKADGTVTTGSYQGSFKTSKESAGTRRERVPRPGRRKVDAARPGVRSSDQHISGQRQHRFRIVEMTRWI